MAVLGSLKVLLFGDSTQLEKTLKNTRKGVDTFKKYAMQAAGAIGVAFSFTAAIQGLSKFYNRLDDIGKKSSALGVTAEYYQKMQYAAERTGSSLDQVYASMNRLVKFAGDAKIGNAEAKKTFAALGISMDEINGLRTDELFELVNRQLAEMPDNLARNAYGAKLMGEEYGRLSNYLRDYIALGKEAEEKGLIISSEQVKEVEALKDAFTDVGKSIEIAVARLTQMTGLTAHLRASSEGITAISGGAKNAEKKAGILSEAEMIADARRRIAADPQLASKFRSAGDSSDLAVKRFAQANKMYSSYAGNSQSWWPVLGLSMISPIAGAIALTKNLAAGGGSERYLARSTDREVQLLRDVATRRYADQQEIWEAEEIHKKVRARYLAGEQERKLRAAAAEEELKAIAAAATENAKRKSGAILSFLSAPTQAGVALNGSIEAYKSQFNNERNFQHFMRESFKKSTDLQQQIATNTAVLNNGLPAIVGAEIGSE